MYYPYLLTEALRVFYFSKKWENKNVEMLLVIFVRVFVKTFWRATVVNLPGYFPPW